ncbi:HI0074 family nucleotidyltransferase substrate-binding subunit [Sphingomonas bacterium]|uniref:HI0074 family nucleotidyltransferase substrate-binding subunit n=1 Tax=Sphingomonas bacterium TaxID=1895847 RepID=UPI001576CFF8|nr:HI0074 family nucleotidyltransferase substrate-binding subunit [Sphingomonas bacterium]
MDEASADTPRWVQRFRNFDGALVLLREGVGMLDDPSLPVMAKEGLIQRFAFTFELAWKTLADFLDFRKVTLERRGPGDVLRMAFATGYLGDGPIWMDALDARNELSHTDRRQAFERVLADIPVRFIGLFEDLHEMLMIERAALDGR